MQNVFKESYRSNKVLGKIFRAVKALTYSSAGGIEDCIDKSLIIPGSERYLEDARIILLQYNQDIWHFMRRYGVDDEQTLMSGFVREFSQKMVDFRSRNGAVQDRLNREIANVRREYREVFWSDVDEDDNYDALAKVSAWYQVAYLNSKPSEMYQPPSLISFPWVMHSLLCKLKQYVSSSTE